MLNWYCFPVIRNRENVAAAYLQSLNLQSLNPRTISIIVNDFGKRYEVARPLFPGYIFAECRLSDWNLKIQRAPGIRKPVRFTDDPYIVPFDVIDEIRERSGIDGFVQLCEPTPVDYQPGDEVRVTSGLWRGFEGLFQSDANGRVLCLLRAISDVRLEPTPVYKKVVLSRSEIALVN